MRHLIDDDSDFTTLDDNDWREIKRGCFIALFIGVLTVASLATVFFAFVNGNC